MVEKLSTVDQSIGHPLRVEGNPTWYKDIITIEFTAKTEDYCIIGLSEPLGSIRRMKGANLSKGLNCIPKSNLERYAAGSYTQDIKNYDGKNLYTTELTKN